MATSSMIAPPAKALTVRDVANTPVMWIYGFAMVFMIAAFNLMDVRVGKQEVELDFQVLAKLGIIAMASVYSVIGVLTEQRVRKVLFSYPGLWLTIIVGFYGLSCITALLPTFAIASTGTLAVVIVTTVTACIQLGLVRVLNAVFYALALYVVGSWFVYFLVPSIGVYRELTSGGRFAERMAGLAHPNTLGQFSGCTVVLGTFLYTKYDMRSKFRVMIIGLAALELIFSFSRTSLGATVVALVFGFRHKFMRSEYLMGYLALAALGVAGLMIATTSTDVERAIVEKLAGLSKSGDASEIYTATGRSDIWAYAIGLISESPVTGYGPASSKELMQEYSRYTHNLVLNVALSTGVIGGLCALLMVLSRIRMIFRRQNTVADALAVFIVTNGLFENVIFSILAGMPTVVWVVALTWWSYGDKDELAPSDRVAEPTPTYSLNGSA